MQIQRITRSSRENLAAFRPSTRIIVWHRLWSFLSLIYISTCPTTNLITTKMFSFRISFLIVSIARHSLAVYHPVMNKFACRRCRSGHYNPVITGNPDSAESLENFDLVFQTLLLLVQIRNFRKLSKIADLNRKPLANQLVTTWDSQVESAVCLLWQ